MSSSAPTAATSTAGVAKADAGPKDTQPSESYLGGLLRFLQRKQNLKYEWFREEHFKVRAYRAKAEFRMVPTRNVFGRSMRIGNTLCNWGVCLYITLHLLSLFVNALASIGILHFFSVAGGIITVTACGMTVADTTSAIFVTASNSTLSALTSVGSVDFDIAGLPDKAFVRVPLRIACLCIGACAIIYKFGLYAAPTFSLVRSVIGYASLACGLVSVICPLLFFLRVEYADTADWTKISVTVYEVRDKKTKKVAFKTCACPVSKANKAGMWIGVRDEWAAQGW